MRLTATDQSDAGAEAVAGPDKQQRRLLNQLLSLRPLLSLLRQLHLWWNLHDEDAAEAAAEAEEGNVSLLSLLLSQSHRWWSVHEDAAEAAAEEEPDDVNLRHLLRPLSPLTPMLSLLLRRQLRQ